MPVGAYEFPATPTGAMYGLSPKVSFTGSFTGTTPPSPPGPQFGVYDGFAGTWTIDSASGPDSSGNYTWHGTWTGTVGL